MTNQQMIRKIAREEREYNLEEDALSSSVVIYEISYLTQELIRKTLYVEGVGNFPYITDLSDQKTVVRTLIDKNKIPSDDIDAYEHNIDQDIEEPTADDYIDAFIKHSDFKIKPLYEVVKSSAGLYLNAITYTVEDEKYGNIDTYNEYVWSVVPLTDDEAEEYLLSVGSITKEMLENEVIDIYSQPVEAQVASVKQVPIKLLD